MSLTDMMILVLSALLSLKLYLLAVLLGLAIFNCILFMFSGDSEQQESPNIMFSDHTEQHTVQEMSWSASSINIRKYGLFPAEDFNSFINTLERLPGLFIRESRDTQNAETLFVVKKALEKSVKHRITQQS